MDNIMDSLKSMTPRRNRRAGRSASGGPPTSLSTSSTMLPLDLGGAGAGGEFGGQAMSILNTLRSRGFGSLGTTVEEQKEEVAPTPSSTGEEEEVKEDDDASVGDETMSDGPGDETLASLAVDDEEEEEEEGEGDLTVVLDSPPSEFDHEEEDSPSPSPK
ncbi:hypothetical protein BDY24DRAFT_207595 [Mrakia frigida]|uniref:uncharacterized protein n=1 Tax=Mrakia frigida TaxID=29902 RepID=UPI003FCC21BB